MSLINLRNQVMGSYYCNAFCITLDEDVHIFERGVKKPKITSVGDFSIFQHEYWHYLLNMSTVSGFKSFSLYQSLLAIFSKTLMKHANGLVDCDSLEENDRKIVSSLIELIKLENGYILPEGLSKDAIVKDFNIISTSISKCDIELEGRTVSHEQVILDLEIDVGTPDTISKEFILGAAAIDEGIAHEVEKMIKNYSDLPVQSPPFPYSILRKLSEYYLKRNVSSYEICALATISMLTVNPAYALVTILQLYKASLDSGISIEEAIKLIWIKIKPQISEYVEQVAFECSDLKDMHKGRGLVEYAIDFISSQYVEMLNKRLKMPLFDLEPFAEDNCNLSKINIIINEIIPCDTIQQEIGDDDDICKDQLLSFGEQKEWKKTKYRPTDFLRVQQCQLHYLSSHLSNTGFKSSNQTKKKCPFYTICDLTTRKNNKDVCKKSPWEVAEDCWYGAAVKSTIGIVEVKEK